MERAADGNAAGVTAEAAQLEALRWHWGDAYDIGVDDGDRWWFRRRDGRGGKETAGSPDALRRAIIEDYTFCPVRREAALDVEERRGQYEAAGVRIWRDPGGWHARWTIQGKSTGISHPEHLAGLLDWLDALQGTRQ